jgi:hypothetical protein
VFVLNTSKVWDEKVRPRFACLVSVELVTRISDLYKQYYKGTDNSDFSPLEKLKKDSRYATFAAATAELQQVPRSNFTNLLEFQG